MNGLADPRAARSHRNTGFLLAVAGLALLATVNILPNGFTYDDRFIIVGNPAVRHIEGWKQFFLLPYWPLHQGGDGYRPLTILSFAMQWAAWPDPWFFHAVSVLLYTLCALAVFRVASMIVSRWCAWWTAALFAVHPVHVEATAGVVGQAELAAGLLIFVAVGLFIDGRRRGALTALRQVAIASVFLIACLFKEHAVVIPILLLLCEWAFVEDTGGWRNRVRGMRVLIALIGLFGLSYLAIRSLVVPLGLVGFAPYTPFVTLQAGPAARAVTMLGMVPEWIRLLFFPLRLSAEYGPPRYAVGGWGSAQWIGLALVTILAAALYASVRRNRTVAFAILWSVVLLLPVSNVLVPSGVLIAERTLFTPAFSACLLVAMAITWLAPRVVAGGSLARTAGLVAAGGLLVFGVARSIVRAADWRDNESLFTAAVSAEPRVYRSHYMLGAWYLETGRWPQARAELTKAMALFDRDPAVAYNLGIGYFGAGEYSRAFQMFETVQRVMPGVLDAKTKMALALAAEGRLGEARDVAADALKDKSDDPAALQAIVRAAALAEKVARSEARAR